MIKVIALFISLISTLNLVGQVRGVDLGFCKKKDVEIITGDEIPDGYLIVTSGFFVDYPVGNSLEELTEKQDKWVRVYCTDVECCTVYIDFKQTLNPKEINEKLDIKYVEKLEDNIDNLIHFYVLAPIWEL